MFDCKQTLMTRLTDAVDLVMDFATLGEYGLEPISDEPVGRTSPSCGIRHRTSTPPRRTQNQRRTDRALSLRP
jgi:hypothetical protein